MRQQVYYQRMSRELYESLVPWWTFLDNWLDSLLEDA